MKLVSAFRITAVAMVVTGAATLPAHAAGDLESEPRGQQEIAVQGLLKDDRADLAHQVSEVPEVVTAAHGLFLHMPPSLVGDPLVTQEEVAAAKPGVSISGAGSEPQVVFQVADATAAHSFSFEVSGADAAVGLPTGEVVLSREGISVGQLDAPWAVAADGSSVRTWFEVDGTAVTQVIEVHPDTAYPVVADPSLSIDWFPSPVATIKFDRDETKYIATIGVAGAAYRCFTAFKTQPHTVAACTAIVTVAGATADLAASKAGKCLAMKVRWLPNPSPMGYPWIVNC